MEVTGPTGTIRRARELRREMSLPEVLLWRELRKRPAGLKFRRQHPAGRYILDFYVDAPRLAVEVDGAAHDCQDRPERDATRDAWLRARGVAVVRITARDILSNLEGAVRHIVDVARAAAPCTTGYAGGPPLPAGEEYANPPPQGEANRDAQRRDGGGAA